MSRRMLSDAEVAQYWRDGYLVVEDFISQDVIDEINGELDAFLGSEKYAEYYKANANPNRKTQMTGWIFNLANTTKKVGDLCREEAILDLISPIVYPGIAIYSAKMVNKEPRDATECLWHQDEAYYIQYSKSRARMSIWLPLQDVDVKNGCLRVIPGSHLEGLKVSSQKAEGHCNLSVDVPLDLSRVKLVPMKAGSILLFDSLTLHSSGGNDSDKARRAFIVSYQEANTTGGKDGQWEILRRAEVATV